MAHSSFLYHVSPHHPCLLSEETSTQLEGWWTYEFCPRKHIRQYHQEKGEPIRPQDEFYLGRYVKDSGREEMEHFSEVCVDGIVDVSHIIMTLFCCTCVID